MASVRRIIRKHYADRAHQDSKRPTLRSVREPSTTEREAIYVSSQYRSIFCFHNVPIFKPCLKCRRTKEFASKALQRTLRYLNIAVQ